MPDATQLDYSPADEALLTSNPPSFVWIPLPEAVSYRLEYSTDPNFRSGPVTVVDGIDLSVFTPDHTFETGTVWYWRVKAVDRQGNARPTSQVRRFRIDRNAIELPLPAPDVLRRRVPREHPRLFVTPTSLETFRERRRSDDLSESGLWSDLRKTATEALTASLPDEPPHCMPDGVWDVNLWGQYVIAARAADTMELLAFVYLLTEELVYAEAAKQWMGHIASWDPYGATSAAVNDESSMPILLKMSRAYSWIHDTLSAEDKAVIHDVVRIRANEAYMILKNRPFESRPYGSHDARQLGFLIEPALAFLHEIPEAQDWFDYSVRVVFAVYPTWGGDAGGWSEGQAYWQAYIDYAIAFADGLREAAGLDLFKKHFFRNTGYFKLYTHPPYAKMGPFGDFAHRKPSVADGTTMRQFALEYGNPYFEWYAEQTGGTAETGVMGYIRSVLRPPISLQSESPSVLAPSRYFPDIGWVAMHRCLGDVSQAIQFMFRSSQYGSYSHAMADQNTFTMEAYGEPLAISSGYRPWYGSDHHMRWTKATQAHNGILVNGEGQPVQSIEARGDIIRFVHGRSFDYTVGDATAAYPNVLDHFHRHVVYIRPDLFVIFDDLVGRGESEYSWLLHSYYKMHLDPTKGTLLLQTPKATLQGQLWSSHRYAMSQTNEFAVPLDKPMDVAEQWHLTARTIQAAKKAFFLAALRPTPAHDSSRFVAEPLSIQAGQGLRLWVEGRLSDVVFRSGEGDRVSAALSSDGVVAVWTRSAHASAGGEHDQGILLIDGSKWTAKNGLRLQAASSLNAELTLDFGGDGRVVRIEGSFQVPESPGAEPCDVTLHIPGLGAVQSVDSDRQIDHCFTQDKITLRLQPGETRYAILASMSKAEFF